MSKVCKQSGNHQKRSATTLLWYLCALVLWMCPISGLDAQTSDTYPKVGLVLSGGGAKGLAHIGVLKVLEEVGIVPDYITGTSMGSIVGGLYAIGYTVEELDSLARHMNWDAVLSNQTALSNIAIEEKPYYGRYQVSLPIEKWSIGLPRGLIEGQELSKTLTRLTIPVHHVQDFDSLPRPFRCVSTDIETGLRVVHDSGFLPQAIRASMAIPSIFTPVELDGKLLVDGGLVHNFPVDEVLDMGADIVIGVAVSDSLYKADKLNSLIAILNQATFIMSVNNTLDQIELVDYFLRPQMDPYATGSFNDCDSIIARGEQCGRSAYTMLKRLADSLHQLRTFEPIEKPTLDPSLRIGEISVVGNDRIPEQLILRKMRVQSGDTLRLNNIESRIDAIYGTRYFDRIMYAIESDSQGLAGLRLDVKESAPGSVAFNLHYDTENSVGLLTNLTFRNLLIPNTRFILEADIADVFYFNTQYQVYTGARQNMAVAIGARFFSDEVAIFDIAGNPEQTFSSKLWNYYLRFQSTYRRNSTYGVAFSIDQNTLRPKIGSEDVRIIDRLRYNNVGGKAFFLWDNTNRRAFPTSGHYLNASFTYLLSMEAQLLLTAGSNPDIDFDMNQWSLETVYRKHWPVGSKWVISTGHTLRLTNIDTLGLNVSDYSFVGGFKPNFVHTYAYWGADKYEFQLSSFYLANLSAQFEPWRNVFFTAGLNYLETQYPMEWLSKSEFENLEAGGQKRRLGGILEAAYNSRLGPVKLAVTHDFDRDRVIVFLGVGFNFRNYKDL